MKNFLLCVSILLSFVAANAQQIARGLTAANSEYIGFYEYKPTDYNSDPTIKYPLIIFLHGIGERGNGTSELSRVTAQGIPRYIQSGHPMRFYWNGKWETFLVLSPQLSNSYGWWQNFYAEEMIKYAKQNLRVDTNRIVLTGLSLGGGGTWSYPGESLSNARKLAAIAPVCGTCQGMNWCNISNANLPTWAFHSADDPVVPVGCTTGGISNINACNPAVKPYMSVWPDGSHAMWDRAFDYNYNWQTPNVYEWFLGQDKSLPVNVRPVANAGADVTVSALTGMVNLSGSLSTDADGSLVRYAWRQTAGPAVANITIPVSTNGLTSVTGLAPGTYQFELKAIDNRADWSYDFVTVTVTGTPVSNIPPVTAAGGDQILMTNSTNLDGSNTYDPDGVVISYRWTKIEGPPQFTLTNELSPNAVVSGLAPGIYKFELQSTDNGGATSKDTVIVDDLNMLVPVKLLFFRGKFSGNETQLLWATTSEYNNDRFEIEKSVDGRNFASIGSVKGSELSFTTREYSFTDQMQNNLSYYRLKQVGKDGKYEYSKIITVGKTAAITTLEYFPNPVLNNITILIDDVSKGKLDIRLYNISGKTMKQKSMLKQDDVATATINVQDLSPGLYILEVKSEKGWKEIRKIVKQ